MKTNLNLYRNQTYAFFIPWKFEIKTRTTTALNLVSCFVYYINPCVKIFRTNFDHTQIMFKKM